MALLPRERHRQVALLVGMLAIGLTWAFFEYWYSPRQAEVELLQSRLVQLEDQNRRAQGLAARGATDLEEGLAIYERHLRRLEQLIPRGAEVPVLLRSITSEALRTGVEMGSLRPEPSRQGEFYTLDSYQIAVIGEYHDVGRFLTQIASLPRIMTPLDLELQPFTGAVAEGVDSPVVARFRLETYLSPLAPDPELLEPEEGGGR